ncbi:FHA domain-containing protein [Tabrizicola flagellatus]|uniref:FHA domain-containing protein n=1 Tax=Tabrizicola flagellatus TaxID=2593021 RepID=UPI0011F1F069|nr:FHA domain-containing protein [Tabrizicola flagellatus]
MAALAELEVKRLREALAAAAPAQPAAAQPEPEAPVSVARPVRVVKAKAPLPEGVTPPARGIWEIEDEVSTAAKAEAAPQRRPTRTKTRVLGFDPEAAAVVPMFQDPAGLPIAEATPAPGKGYVMFPAGWLVIKDGPGKGASFALHEGVSQIGRGADQTVSLDYGDMAISRHNHAAIAYDGKTHEFHIGHGGKSNLVRLNGRPLLSTEPAKDGDEIQIGETTLVLKVLCTPEFNWSTYQEEGDAHDMAIA